MLRWISLSLLAVCSEAAESPAYTPEQLTALPVSDWITNGGDIPNQPFSPLAGIPADNACALKAATQTPLTCPRLAPRFSRCSPPTATPSCLATPAAVADL